MNATWADLSKSQRQLLLKLARAEEGYDPDDAVGLPVRQLADELLMQASSLVKLGLVEVWFGWRGIAWLRLTDAGRQVEDGGAVE